jgi:lipopolysaccharide exporter
MSNTNAGLGKAMAIGAAWMTALRFTYRFIGLISTVILARILTPDDFGVVAIAMSFFALIDIFSKLGFETVLIQKKEVTEEHYNTAWTYNVIFSSLAAIILISISSYISELYGNSEMEYILIAISAMFVLNSFKNIGAVDFQKNLTFEKEFKLHIVPKLISFFITICLALYFKNFWALVIGNIIWKVLEVITSYLMHPFRPRLCLTKGNELFNFSKWLMINNLFTFLHLRTPEMILGKMISPHAAAIFNLANEIGRMATSEIIANLNRAIFPGYSRVSSEIPKLNNLYKDSTQFIYLISLPLGVGMALVSPYLVPLLLGSQWLDVIEPLIYLSLGSCINALQSNSNYIYLALGKPRIVTFIGFIRAIIFLTFIFYLVGDFGVIGTAIAYLLTSIIILGLTYCLIQNTLGISIVAQLTLLLRPGASTLIMFIFVKLFIEFTDFNDLISLILSVFIGTVTYISTTCFLWAISGRKEGAEQKILEIITNRLKTKIS